MKFLSQTQQKTGLETLFDQFIGSLVIYLI